MKVAISENSTPNPAAKVASSRGSRRWPPTPASSEAPWARPVKWRSRGSQAWSTKAAAAPIAPSRTKAQCQFQREATRPLTIRPVKPPVTVPVT